MSGLGTKVSRRSWVRCQEAGRVVCAKKPPTDDRCRPPPFATTRTTTTPVTPVQIGLEILRSSLKKRALFDPFRIALSEPARQMGEARLYRTRSLHYNTHAGAADG